MTIERGTDWGTAAPLPDDAPVAHDDGQLADLIDRDRRAGIAPGPIGLLGGDLCRTLGGRGTAEALRADDAPNLPIDVGEATIDGVSHVFVAHLVVRRSWWWGPALVVANAQWLGAWDVAPRAHPNDGLLDVTSGDLDLGDRFKARRRLRTGTHVPHPDITTRRTDEWAVVFDRPTPVWLDGRRMGSVRDLSFRVRPDAACVVV